MGMLPREGQGSRVRPILSGAVLVRRLGKEKWRPLAEETVLRFRGCFATAILENCASKRGCVRVRKRPPPSRYGS